MDRIKESKLDCATDAYTYEMFIAKGRSLQAKAIMKCILKLTHLNNPLESVSKATENRHRLKYS